MRRVALVLACCTIAGACRDDRPADAPTARIEAHRAWARTADSGSLTAAYLVLTNSGDAADTLKGVRSDVALDASMHVSINRGSTVQMVPVGALPVRPGDSLVMQPLGTHVMLTGLRQSLQAGDSIPLLLEFASGTSLAVRLDVRRP